VSNKNYQQSDFKQRRLFARPTGLLLLRALPLTVKIVCGVLLLMLVILLTACAAKQRLACDLLAAVCQSSHSR
jgi:hypothetical protein